MARFQVSPAAAHELLAACRLLFRGEGAEQRRDLLLAADSDASRVFVARGSDGKLHAAALVQTIPGALGVAWPPRGDSHESEDAVTLAACEWLRSRGVRVCQAFASENEVAGMAPLERAGFRRTTQLSLLRSDLSHDYGRTRSLSFSAHRPPLSDEFAATLLATHEGTRDCPELNAARTPAEILAGFVAPGAATWHLASVNGGHVGVVLLEYARGAESAELTYLGVVPPARGCGLGAELLKFAIAEAVAARLSGLNVSVDARNIPAMKLYERHGFVEYDCREVWLASWPA